MEQSEAAPKVDVRNYRSEPIPNTSIRDSITDAKSPAPDHLHSVELAVVKEEDGE